MKNKVLQLTKHYPPYKGGIESVTYDLTEGLIAENTLADVLCCNDSPKTIRSSEFSYNVIRVGCLFKAFSTSISPQLVLELKKVVNNYDIIHVHFPDPMAALALFLCKPKCSILVHWHSDIIKQKSILQLFLPLQNWILKRADKIIGTSPIYIAKSEQLKPFVDKCVSIPIGINKDRIKVDCSTQKDIRSKYAGKRIVFAFGRHVYYKGFEYLIEAAHMLHDDAIILIGGTGPLKVQFESQILKNNLTSKIQLLGWMSDDDVYSTLSVSDVFCFPSIEKSEAFGVVQLEAMYLGIPIVATNIPGSGVSWVNADGVTGINVEPKNSKALADAINKILSDSILASSFSKNGKIRFSEHFTVSKMVRAVKDVYTKLLE